MGESFHPGAGLTMGIALDADIGKYEILMEPVGKWIDKRDVKKVLWRWLSGYLLLAYRIFERKFGKRV